MKKILFLFLIVLSFSFVFPTSAQTPTIQDADLDGIIDQGDMCPGTLADADGFFFVDQSGCSCEQKQCLDGFQCLNVFVNEIDPITKNKTVAFRAQCIEEQEENPYDLRRALRDAQNINAPDDRYIPVYPEHLVGADEKSLQGDASDITLFFQRFANGLTILAGSIAILFLIINGFLLVVSTGNTDQVSTAKKGILWSVISLFLIIFSYIIVKTVLSLTYSGQEFEDMDEKKKNPLQETQDNFDSTNEKIKKTNTDIENKERYIDSLEQEVDILNKSKNNLIQQNALSDEGEEKLDKEIEDLENQIDKEKDAVNALKDKRDDLEKARDTYQEILSEG